MNASAQAPASRSSALCRAAFACLLFATSAGLVGCTPPSIGVPCVSADDCAFGDACINGQCTTGSRPTCHAGRSLCASSDDCASGHCDEGCCAPTCASRLDCADDELCRDSHCQRRDSLPTCSRDSECAGRIGQPRCHPGFEMCVACLSDSDCGSERACDGNNRCVQLPGSCGDDDDCPSMEVPRCESESKRCVACLSDDDCPSDKGCEEHTCVPRPVSCSQHSDCEAMEGQRLCNPDTLVCVSCIDDTHCPDDHRCNPGTFVCDALPGCGNDDDCVGDPGGARCRFEDRRCVSCREDDHCDEGERCLAGNSCGRAGECGGDGDCDVDRPFCRLDDQVCIECRGDDHCGDDGVCHSGACIPVDGCTADEDCPEESPRCRAEIGLCVECRAPSDCDVFERCIANACVDGGCSSHVQCAQEYPETEDEPARPFCQEATCVECLGDRDCAATRVCWDGRCAPARCESNDDCSAFPGRSRCSGFCVECVDAADCEGDSECQGNRCVEACTADGDCLASSLHQRCRLDDGVCVQCVRQTDCPIGSACQDNVCVETGLDLPCEHGWWCADGQTCVESAEGGFPRCRQSCDPYLLDPGCPAHRHCDVVGFGPAGRPAGACIAGAAPGRGEGETCSAQSLCAPHLSCVAESATESRCRRHCDPAASTEACPSPLFCEPTVRLDENEVPRVVGLCVAETARSTRCDDASDCRDGQVCVAGVPGDSPLTPASVCRWPVGVRDGAEACSADSECRSGRCVRGAPRSLGALSYCQEACATDSDCPGGSSCTTHTFRWFDALGYPRDYELPACVPACAGDFDCSANDTCVPVPNREGTRWTSRCTPRHPLATRGPGDRCQNDAQCVSGACLRHGANATDGICLGACDPARNGADCSGGSVCPSEGVLFVVGAGPDGVPGNADDPAERTNVCWGPTCRSDSDCRDLSNDPNRPRACSPEADPANPDDLVLRCLPRYGNGPPGGYCEVHSDCQSGLCVTWSNPAEPADASQFRKRCFGACRPPGGLFPVNPCWNDTVCREIRWTDSEPNKALEVCVPVYPASAP